MEFFNELGYAGLFISAFLAATILPLSSELVLSALLLNGFNPIFLVLLATVGNVLGSVVNYFIGRYGSDYIRHKFLKTTDEEFERSRQRYEKWGRWSLLLAWVPVIGDPLTVMAGILRVNFIWFLTLVTIGKFLRYVVISYGVLAVGA